MQLTLQEVMDICPSWDDFCELKGFSPYAVNEGGGHVEVSLTLEEACNLKMVKSWKYPQEN